MPEYLAPGVYVEEIDTGSKPIEGVSTSTCGMVGVAERGPVDVPVLVTSVGEYARWFGGLLRSSDYGGHRFLPHAVEGFFTNGGKRTYVVRAIDASATRASSALFDRGDGSLAIALLRAAGEGTGTTAAQPGLVVLPSASIVANDWVRIGDGSTAEYHQAQLALGSEKFLVTVDLPLARTHASGEAIRDYQVTTGVDYLATESIAEGDASIVVRSTHSRIETLRADVAANAGHSAGVPAVRPGGGAGDPRRHGGHRDHRGERHGLDCADPARLTPPVRVRRHGDLLAGQLHHARQDQGDHLVDRRERAAVRRRSGLVVRRQDPCRCDRRRRRPGGAPLRVAHVDDGDACACGRLPDGEPGGERFHSSALAQGRLDDAHQLARAPAG